MTSAVQYAIVGTGSIGTVLAQRFSDHHVPALFANTRGPETIDVTELSASITPVTLDTALDADVIILAIPFLQVRELGAAPRRLVRQGRRRHDERVSGAQLRENPRRPPVD